VIGTILKHIRTSPQHPPITPKFFIYYTPTTNHPNYKTTQTTTPRTHTDNTTLSAQSHTDLFARLPISASFFQSSSSFSLANTKNSAPHTFIAFLRKLSFYDDHCNKTRLLFKRHLHHFLSSVFWRLLTSPLHYQIDYTHPKYSNFPMLSNSSELLCLL